MWYEAGDDGEGGRDGEVRSGDKERRRRGVWEGAAAAGQPAAGRHLDFLNNPQHFSVFLLPPARFSP